MLNAPPPAAFPAMFIVGDRRTEAFVNTAQLKGHLVLLDQFMQLRSRADNAKEFQGMPKDKDSRRTWFVGLAVER